MFLQALLLILSIVILYFGAEFALSSAERIGRALKLSSLVVGVFIIGFGTSLPELFVSQIASANGEYGIALGNVVGSNVANFFLILGLAAVLTPIAVATKEIKSQLIFVSVLTIAAFFMFMQPVLWWYNCLILLGFFAFFLYRTYQTMKASQVEEEIADEHLDVMVFAKLILGFAFLYGGGELLVSSGKALGDLAGIDPYIISVIFVAFGTSFPELVTSLIACYEKKDTDLIVGNILGSNIFNMALILGSLFMHNVKIEEQFIPEFTALIFANLFLLGFCTAKKQFSKIGGIVFLASYGVMLWYWIS